MLGGGYLSYHHRHFHHLMLLQTPGLCDILVSAYAGCPGNNNNNTHLTVIFQIHLGNSVAVLIGFYWSKDDESGSDVTSTQCASTRTSTQKLFEYKYKYKY